MVRPTGRTGATAGDKTATVPRKRLVEKKLSLPPVAQPTTADDALAAVRAARFPAAPVRRRPSPPAKAVPARAVPPPPQPPQPPQPSQQPKPKKQLSDDRGPPAKGMARCPLCARDFAADRLPKHEEVCRRSRERDRKRKVFDASRKRLEAVAAEAGVDVVSFKKKVTNNAGKRGRLAFPSAPAEPIVRVYFSRFPSRTPESDARVWRS